MREFGEGGGVGFWGFLVLILKSIDRSTDIFVISLDTRGDGVGLLDFCHMSLFLLLK